MRSQEKTLNSQRDVFLSTPASRLSTSQDGLLLRTRTRTRTGGRTDLKHVLVQTRCSPCPSPHRLELTSLSLFSVLRNERTPAAWLRARAQHRYTQADKRWISGTHERSAHTHTHTRSSWEDVSSSHIHGRSLGKLHQSGRIPQSVFTLLEDTPSQSTFTRASLLYGNVHTDGSWGRFLRLMKPVFTRLKLHLHKDDGASVKAAAFLQQTPEPAATSPSPHSLFTVEC